MEILSESTSYYDLRQKKRVYEKTGVKEYWIVDPMERSIEVYENRDAHFHLIERAEEIGTIKKGIIRSRLLEGFSLKVEEIF